VPLDPQTVSALEPAQFVALVKELPDADIRAAFGGEHREALLDAVFARFPGQFRAGAAGDRSARIDFRVTGGPDGSSDTYAVVVADGTCAIDKYPGIEPNLSLMLGPVEFLKLIAGVGNPVMMFMTGKVKARGDVGLASALQRWFETPTA
jgi:hypothetical protein